MGSMSGAAKEAIDSMRDRGVKVGLLRMRLIRPFPAQRLAELVKGKKGLGIVDRNVSFGWNTGIVFQEISAALSRYKVAVPARPFIAGLGGEDVRKEHVEYAIRQTTQVEPDGVYETIWLNKVEEI